MIGQKKAKKWPKNSQKIAKKVQKNAKKCSKNDRFLMLFPFRPRFPYHHYKDLGVKKGPKKGQKRAKNGPKMAKKVQKKCKKMPKKWSFFNAFEKSSLPRPPRHRVKKRPKNTPKNSPKNAKKMQKKCKKIENFPYCFWVTGKKCEIPDFRIFGGGKICFAHFLGVLTEKSNQNRPKKCQN